MKKLNTLLFFLIIQVSILYSQDWQYFNVDNSGIPSNHIRNFAIDHDGNIWVGTQDAGLGRLSNGIWTTFNTSNSPIPSNNVQRVVVDKNNKIWITNHLGNPNRSSLSRISNGNWTTWTHFVNNRTTSVSDLSTDGHGNIWMVGVHSKSLIKFNGSSFTNYDHQNSCLPVFSGDGYLPKVINHISYNKRWVGLNFNGVTSNPLPAVVLMEGDSCQFFNANNSNLPEKGRGVHEIYTDPNDEDVIWISTFREIASYRDGEWGNIIEYTSASPHLIAIDQSGTMYVVIISTGVGVYKDGEWQVMYGQPGYEMDELHIDENQRLWVATETNGLAYLDLDVVSTPVKEVTANKIKVYPSHFSHEFFVDIELNDDYQLLLVDVLGRKIHEERLERGTNQITIEDAQTRFVFYTIYNDKGDLIQSGKLIKK